MEVIDIGHTGHLPDAVHGQLGDPDVDGGHAQAGRRHRTDGGAAGQIVAVQVVLERHVGLDAGRHHLGIADGIGGVALVGVPLDDDPGVDGDGVRRLVPVDVVRVGGVGPVGRDDERAGQRGQEAVPIGPDDTIDLVMDRVTQVYLAILERNLDALC